MAVHKRSDADWVELVEQQRASGQTLKAWCTENGINFYTMADRISRLRKRGYIDEHMNSKSGAKWLEVTESPVVSPLEPEIRIRLNNFTIVVPKDFGEGSFVRVCKALMSIC